MIVKILINKKDTKVSEKEELKMGSRKIKAGIYGIGLLMMGVIGISSSLAIIGAHFPDVSQTMNQNLISIPCVVIIPTTLIVGKLMQSISKKYIVLTGIFCFFIGGIAPAFLNNFTVILVMRAILGVGVGVCQVVSTAIAVENFEGEEQEKVQGTLQTFQMLGAAIMVFVGGSLADIRWNYAFYVHIIAVVAFILVLLFVPAAKPVKIQGKTSEQKTHLTVKTWGWAVFMLVLFICFQIYNVGYSYVIDVKGLGTASDAGLGVAFFTIAGMIMGLIYGRVAKVVRNYSIAIACLMLVISYILITFSGNIAMCYCGSIFYGLSVAMALPGIFYHTGLSVDAYSAGMAVSVVTCAQNFGQFLCPYIINPIAGVVSPENSTVMCFGLGIGLAVVLTVVIFIWGIRKTQ